MIVNMVGSSGKGLFSRIADLQVLLVYFEDTIINFRPADPGVVQICTTPNIAQSPDITADKSPAWVNCHRWRNSPCHKRAVPARAKVVDQMVILHILRFASKNHIY